MNRLSLLAGAGVAALAGTASANVEIGGIAGVHVFSETNELGVPDTATAFSQRNSAVFGARIGYYFNSHLGIELDFGVIPSEARQMVIDVWNITYRAHLIYQFRAANPDNKVVPFIFGGAGVMQVVSTQNRDLLGGNCGNDLGPLDQLPSKAQCLDADGMFYVGFGAKYRVDNGWGLRGDVYVLFPPSSHDKGPVWFDGSPRGGIGDAEFVLSIYKEWGRPKKQEKKASNDKDGDGIPDDVDKCPDEPEDKDGYQDEDGCPDLDNDGDGIPDKQDKCPNEAEDFDGFQDADGCPDNDNDNDKISDAADQCPNEPEDYDGFQDADGCPDPDNDHDGIPDVNDKCPNEPETMNGYQDADGCPDTVPEKLKKFTGVIAGVNFKVNDATLLPGSNKTLDQAVAVLKEFTDIKLEIQGHTDDQPMGKGGKFNDNKALSQARAETVKAYFVSKGIEEGRLTANGYGDEQPMENPTGLKGAKLTAARAKNRRVEFKLSSK
jgi:OOP family OmpA-OmpF porin